MIPDKAWCEALHKKYARNSTVYDVFYTHCRIVADISLWCAGNTEEPVDLDVLEAAALLHDIGAYMLTDQNGKIDKKYYQLHGLLGASLLEDEGVDQKICDIVRSHLLKINTPEIVASINKMMPEYRVKPATVEGKIVAYADRFHSKEPTFNSEKFLTTFLDKLPDTKQIYLQWRSVFGLPDIEGYAKTYNQPIR